MEVFNVSDFVGGWFLGDFSPTLDSNPHFEACLKRYSAGALEPLHHQRVSTEYTVVVTGRCRIGEVILGPGDILRIPPLEAADFEALTDVSLVAIKTPSIPADKVLGEAT